MGSARAVPPRALVAAAWRSRAAISSFCSFDRSSGVMAGFSRFGGRAAINIRMLGLNQRSSRATTWHLCRVIVPRRTITGRLARGKVWRRHDGRHWLYKKFVAG